MKRVVTYDVKKDNNYDRFYQFIKEAKAEKITESTYLFDTNLNQEAFQKKLKWAFNKGDNVSYITENDNIGLFYIKINFDK